MDHVSCRIFWRVAGTFCAAAFLVGVMLACDRRDPTESPAAAGSEVTPSTTRPSKKSDDLAAIVDRLRRSDPSAIDLASANEWLGGRLLDPEGFAATIALTRAESASVRRLAWRLLDGENKTLVIWRRRVALSLETDESVRDEIIRTTVAQPHDLESVRALRRLSQNDGRAAAPLREVLYEVLRRGGVGAIKRSAVLLRRTATIERPTTRASIADGDFQPWPGRVWSDAALRSTKPAVLFLRVRLREGGKPVAVSVTDDGRVTRFNVDRPVGGDPQTTVVEIPLEGRTDAFLEFSVESGDPGDLEFSDIVLVDAAAFTESAPFPTRLFSPREICGDGARVVAQGPILERGLLIDGERATIRIPIDPADRPVARRIVVGLEHASPDASGATFDVMSNGALVLRIVAQPLGRLHTLTLDVPEDKDAAHLELVRVSGGRLILTGAGYAAPPK